MYNFNEIKNLSELKELCFYIKAIHESKQDIQSKDGIKNVVSFLKKQYNLEITVSKLYLFVEKIVKITGNNNFPKVGDEKDIICEYIKFVDKSFLDAESEVIKEEFNLKEPKHKITTDEFKSSFELKQDISVKRKLYTQKSNSIIAWSSVLALFLVSFVYCFMGVAFPRFLTLFYDSVQELALVFIAIVFLAGLFSLIFYLFNRTELKLLKTSIKNYYKFEPVILDDIHNYEVAKNKLNILRNKFSINGIQLSNQMMYNYLYNTDEVDIKLFASNNLQKKEFNKFEKKSFVSTLQVVSKHEQDKKWKESQLSKHEKEKINSELVSRIDQLASFLKNKDLTDIDLAHAISGLYCTELSVTERTKKIDEADSKYELSKNYVGIVDKILRFESFDIFSKLKINQISKSIMTISQEEKKSFEDSIDTMLNRIDKACSLKLLTDGNIMAFEILRDEIRTGVYQGVDFRSLSYRYDLAKIYIKICDELSIYDCLN